MEEDLSVKKKVVLWVILTSIPIFIFVVFPILTVFYSDIKSSHYSFRNKFKVIKPGDKKINVIQLLGQPDEESNEFHLGQYQGFEEEYKNAQEIDSEYYLFWYRGIDVTYAVGFNKDWKQRGRVLNIERIQDSRHGPYVRICP